MKPTVTTRSLHRAASALALVLCSVTGAADKNVALHHLKINPFPNQREIYKRVGGGELEARIYYPNNQIPETPRPAAVVIHGGGWTSPGTKHTALHCRYLARRGVVAVNIEYRLADRDTDVRIDDCLEDCRDALRYVFAEAGRLKIDPNRIAVLGESAGGQLAAMLALTRTAEVTDEPEAKQCPAVAVLYNPCLDLEALPWMRKHAGLAPVGVVPEEETWRDRARRLSPIRHVDEGDPPILLIHGTGDSVVPVEQADRFARAVRNAKGTVEYHRMEGWGHAFALPEIGAESQILETLSLTDAFLAAQGFLEGECPIGEPFEPTDYSPLVVGEAREEPHVMAESHSLERWPYIDGQWEGITVTDNGYVYFGVSSHDRLQHAQLFRYSMAKDNVEHLADMGAACGETQLNSPTQDKIHSMMFEHGDVVYCGTCDGHASYIQPYQGGYWLAIDKHTGEVKNLGRTITRDGLICVGHDPWRNLLYGLGNHKGLLSVFDPETGDERILGFPWKGSGADWPRGLTMMIPEDGRVYGFRRPHGSIWQYDPETGGIRTLDLTIPVPDEIRSPEATEKMKEQWKNSAGHLTLWNEQDQCFYFIRSFDEALARFYPPEGDGDGRIEIIRSLHPDIPRLWGNRPAACVLSIHNRTVWYTPPTGWGGETHLVSYHLDTGEFKHYGPILVEKGRRVSECHSMDVGPDGKLYLVAFVYSIKGEDPVRRNGMRGNYPFHPRFVIIDPDEHLKVD